MLLIAALSFAAFSTVHAARAFGNASYESSALFAFGDICGDDENSESRDCPNCVLATALILPEAAALNAPQVFLDTGHISEPGVHAGSRSDLVYRARGPPVFS